MSQRQVAHETDCASMGLCNRRDKGRVQGSRECGRCGRLCACQCLWCNTRAGGFTSTPDPIYLVQRERMAANALERGCMLTLSEHTSRIPPKAPRRIHSHRLARQNYPNMGRIHLSMPQGPIRTRQLGHRPGFPPDGQIPAIRVRRQDGESVGPGARAVYEDDRGAWTFRYLYGVGKGYRGR